MAFADEIRKLQRTMRVFLRYSVGPGSDNPDVSGAAFDRRYAKAADNSGAIPVKGTVLSFGTFSRALTNADQGFETPQVTSELADTDNEWRVLAARPWNLINRFMHYALRVYDDAGVPSDTDLVWGQVFQPEFPPPGKVRMQVQMLPGDHLGKTVPKRRVSVTEWPNADPSAIGAAVPIIYGQMDNTIGNITGFTGALVAPSGHIAPVLAGSLVASGSGAPAAPTGLTVTVEGTPGSSTYRYAISAYNADGESAKTGDVVITTGQASPDAVNRIKVEWTGSAGATGYVVYGRSSTSSHLDVMIFGETTYYDDDDHDIEKGGSPITGSNFADEDVYYALAAVDAGLVSSPRSNIIGPYRPVVATPKVQLTWTAGYTPTAWRLWRGSSADFATFDRYRLGAQGTPSDLAGATTAAVDNFVGISTADQLTPDPHWDAEARITRHYYISVELGGTETVAVGPVSVALQPTNGNGGTVLLTWDVPAGTTAILIRRATQSGAFEPVFDREWTLSAAVTSLVDPLTDTTAVDLPENFARARGGAVRGLYVDSNPGGAGGGYKYLLAGHGCFAVREVYVHKSALTAAGNSAGAIDKPKNVAISQVGATGPTVYRYVVVAVNEIGRTLPSTEVRITAGANPLSGANRHVLSWDAVTGATSYEVFRGGELTDYGRLAAPSGVTFTDDGAAAPDMGFHPPEVNTTGTNYQSGSQTSPVLPVLMTKNVDYAIEVNTVNGQVFQILRFLTSQEGNDVTANVWGVEHLGTSNGNQDTDEDAGVLINNIVDQFKHFLLNWVFNSYLSGSWFTDTGYRTGLLNLASFDTASITASTRIVGGYRGAGALTDEIDVRAALQDWLTSADLDWYFWGGQFKVRMFDPAVADRDTLSAYTPKDGIFRETFAPAMDVSRHWNKIAWQAGPQEDGYYFSGSVQDDDSIRDYGREIESPVRTLNWVRDYRTASDLMLRLLRMTKNPPILATFSTPLRALNDEIASLIVVTHPDGIEAVNTGWTRRACKIVRSDIDLDRLIVNLQVQDIDVLLSLLGYMYLGNRNWSVADKSYATASTEKQAVYAYLADRTTGRFSNGDTTKKLGSRT